MIVIDCSVTMPWCFEDQTTPYTESVLNAVATHSAMAPELWALEVANVLAASFRRRVLTESKVSKFRDLLAGLHVRLAPHSQDRALGTVLELAQSHRLTAYDAAYLEVSLRFGLPLASLDQALLAAAKAEGVELFVE